MAVRPVLRAGSSLSPKKILGTPYTQFTREVQRQEINRKWGMRRYILRIRNKYFPALKRPKQCPHVLLAKVS
jgi:hypothetical protein